MAKVQVYNIKRLVDSPSLTWTTDRDGNIEGTVVLLGLPIFANNAAATGGGLRVGALYRTGADPDFVCVVH